MDRRLLIITISVCVSLSIAYGAVVKKGVSPSEWQYQIIDGNCTTAFASDMIFHDHVHKTRLPLVSRDATSSWQGNKKIYCLKVLNEKDASKGATTRVTQGGVGSKNVTIEMHSTKNHGLEFTIQVFAI